MIPKHKVEGVKRATYYTSHEEILETLQGANFNYAFVYAEDKSVKEAIKREYNL